MRQRRFAFESMRGTFFWNSTAPCSLSKSGPICDGIFTGLKTRFLPDRDDGLRGSAPGRRPFALFPLVLVVEAALYSKILPINRKNARQ